MYRRIKKGCTICVLFCIYQIPRRYYKERENDDEITTQYKLNNGPIGAIILLGGVDRTITQQQRTSKR